MLIVRLAVWLLINSHKDYEICNYKYTGNFKYIIYHIAGNVGCHIGGIDRNEN